jgi:hypothetical protein
MRYLKGFNESRAEEIFNRQTPLERQFSKIMISGLSSDDVDVSHYWSTINAIKVNIKEDKLLDETSFKEMMHRIVEGEDPTEVMNDICARMKKPTSELKKLLKKLNSF